MFENFLDSGVKQSEGQFFTPMPITRFILQSLPLENIIEESQQPPKSIDYACGSGHFLNELASQIRPFVETTKIADIEEYHKEIYGIEKEYRLSKVAKVSAFMYGQDKIDLTYADALEKNEKFKNGTFKILVANPPYSVKGFLSTLSQESREQYELIKTIEPKAIHTNNSIECFFIERAKQFLDANGIAGIIVPSSILTNDNATYQETRSILLKYFNIVAITEFGSGTFGKTGTNTVTLFLKRRDEKPELAEHYKNRVNSWFSNNDDKQKIFKDEHFIKEYCQHLEYEFDDYKTLLNGNPNQDLFNTEMFIDYKNAFNKSSNVKNKKKQKSFTKLTKQEQDALLDKMFIEYVTKIEKEKLYYFTLASSNENEVIIVKSPSDNKNNKKFLGFDWSSAKGNEGIQLFTDKNGKHITPLYDPDDRNNKEKINYYIQQAFYKKNPAIPDNLLKYVNRSSLIDMLDFKRIDFIKQFSLIPRKDVTIKTKWNLVKLGDVCDIKIGGTPSRDNQQYFSGNNLWVSISEMKGQKIIDTKEKITNEAIKNSNVKLIPKGTTLLSFKLSIGKTAIAGKDLYTNEAIAGLIPYNKKEVKNEYLLYLFNSKLIDLESVGNKAFGKSLNSKYLKNDIKIPLPPKEIQEKIIKECKAIDNEKLKINKIIIDAKKHINDIVNNTLNNTYVSYKIDDISNITSGGTPLTKNREYYENGTIPWINSGDLKSKYIFEAKNFITKKGLDNSSAKLCPANSILLAMYGATAGKLSILKIPASTNQAICCIYPNEDKFIPEFLYFQLNHMYDYLLSLRTGVARDNLSLNKIKNIKIKLPDLNSQKKMLEKIEKQEKIIKEAEEILKTIDDRKQNVLKKYLQ